MCTNLLDKWKVKFMTSRKTGVLITGEELMNDECAKCMSERKARAAVAKQYKDKKQIFQGRYGHSACLTGDESMVLIFGGSETEPRGDTIVAIHLSTRPHIQANPSAMAGIFIA